MIGIYKITSPSGKIYIGQSVNIEKRLMCYKNLRCKSQPIIYNSLLKYGFEKHTFEVLCECSIENLNNKERYYQDYFSATGINGMNCVLTASSNKSGKLSKETIIKIKIARSKQIITKEHSEKISKSNTGRKHSKETKEKISMSQKGKIISEESRKKISESAKGRVISEETRIKLSESSKARSAYSIENMAVLKRKLILNTQTGIFYNGLKEASECECIKLGTLKTYMIGIRKNKTDLIYV
jgi:group I intron endonuclease